MMRGGPTGSVAVLAGLATVMVSFGAHAQSAPVPQRVELVPSGNGAVFVQLHAGQRAYSVTPTGGSQHRPNPVIANCEGDCGFWAWPGSYKLNFPISGDKAAVTARVRIRAPGDYALVPANVASRNTGLTLGIAGSAVAFVGLVFVVVGLFATSCDDTDGYGEPSNCGRPAALYYGLGTLAVGAGISTVGWVMYGQNRAHFTYRPPAAAGTPPSMTARVGLMPLPRGGFGLGAAVAF